jgi:hypothetical protein
MLVYVKIRVHQIFIYGLDDGQASKAYYYANIISKYVLYLHRCLRQLFITLA